MKKYYIKLKKGQKKSLLNTISTHVKKDKSKSSEILRQGSVWIDNKRVKDPEMIITEELITVYLPEKPIYEYTLKKENIRYEDDHFIIVNKDPGVNSCPTPMSDLDCMLNGIKKYYKELGLDYDASSINRLDSPTSGLLFFAKNKKMETSLHNLFRLRKIRKLYVAATPVFEMKKKELLIIDMLEWKGKNQEAVSYIKFIKQQNDLLYFLIYPKTGRTHQIRKHFQKYLVSIQGDCLYGSYEPKDKLMLKCFYYRFRHPVTGLIMTVNESDEKNCMN